MPSMCTSDWPGISLAWLLSGFHVWGGLILCPDPPVLHDGSTNPTGIGAGDPGGRLSCDLPLSSARGFLALSLTRFCVVLVVCTTLAVCQSDGLMKSRAHSGPIMLEN